MRGGRVRQGGGEDGEEGGGALEEEGTRGTTRGTRGRTRDKGRRRTHGTGHTALDTRHATRTRHTTRPPPDHSQRSYVKRARYTPALVPPAPAVVAWHGMAWHGHRRSAAGRRPPAVGRAVSGLRTLYIALCARTNTRAPHAPPRPRPPPAHVVSGAPARTARPFRCPAGSTSPA